MLSMQSKVVALLGIIGLTALLFCATAPLWGKPRHHCSSVSEEYHNHRLLRQLQQQRELPQDARAANTAHSAVVEKTAFSSDTRMIFLVGLEGTGHHFMNYVLDQVCQLDEVNCPDACPLAKAVYFDLGTPATAHDYRLGLETLRSEAEALAALGTEGLDDGTVTLMSLGRCSDEVGELSYPNFRGRDKPLQYVDVKVLAEEAERAGIDLRLIYMGRLAKSLLLSDTQNRDFGGGFAHEARILINNAAVIDSTLRELHPSFVSCFSYEMSCDPAQAARLADFIAPTHTVAMKLAKTLLEAVNVEAPATRGDVEDAEGWYLMSDRLQGKLDAIEGQWC